MGFPRQEHRSGLPFPPPGGLANPGIKSWLLHCKWFFTTEPPGKPEQSTQRRKKAIKVSGLREERVETRQEQTSLKRSDLFCSPPSLRNTTLVSLVACTYKWLKFSRAAVSGHHSRWQSTVTGPPLRMRGANLPGTLIARCALNRPTLLVCVALSLLLCVDPLAASRTEPSPASCWVWPSLTLSPLPACPPLPCLPDLPCQILFLQVCDLNEPFQQGRGE